MTKEVKNDLRTLMESFVEDGMVTVARNEQMDETTYILKEHFDYVEKGAFDLLELVVTPDSCQMIQGSEKSLSYLPDDKAEWFKVHAKTMAETEKKRIDREAKIKAEEEYMEALLNDSVTFRNDTLDTLLNGEHDLNTAQLDILRGYYASTDRGLEYLTVDDFNFGNANYFESADQFLTDAGVNEFVVAETSSALMTILAGFNDLGWKMEGTIEQTDRNEYHYRKYSTPDKIVGVHFTK